MSMGERTPLGQSNPTQVQAFWNEFVALAGTDVDLDTPQPSMWPFGDSVELANELLELVLLGPKRATAALAAEFDPAVEPLPEVGDYWIVADGDMRARAVLRTTDVRVGPLSSVDDQFAFDEGEGDRSRAYWLEAHTRAFARTAEALGLDFHPEISTMFERFEVVYVGTT